MTVTVLPEVMQDMTESAYRQQVYIVAETQMHTAPWLFDDEGWDKSRLKAAIELVCTGAVTPTADGWTVQGSDRSTVYAIPRATMQCSCKAAQHARKSQVCKHRVAVELLTRVQQAYPETPALHACTGAPSSGSQGRASAPDNDALGNGFPVDDETLPLPLPPVTVDERLAERPKAPQEDRISTPSNRGEAISTELVAALHAREGSPRQRATLGESTSLPLGQTDSAPGIDNALQLQKKYGGITPEPNRVSPQAGAFSSGESVPSIVLPMQAIPEDRMTEDAEAYIPEPDDAPVAVEDAPVPTRALPGPVLLPSLDAQSLKRSMQEWSAQRQVIRSFLQQELKEGVDFYRLQVRGKDANPTLSKAGAEKFLGLFQLQASFAPDLLTWEMLGKPTDHVIYICTLRTRSGEIVGEGRGSRSLKKDSGDTNKAIKMSEKSALIDAVLRTGALSEVYTQDVEDLQEEPAPATPAKPTSQETVSSTAQALRQRIWTLVKQAAPHATTREDVEHYVQRTTGYALHPDRYGDIIRALEARP
jgi:hypothetical protein